MTRKRILIGLLIIIPLTGCYSMLVVNLGIANKNASALAVPLDPAVACAALAPIRIKVDSKNPVQPDVATDWTSTCEKVLTEQQKKKAAQ